MVYLDSVPAWSVQLLGAAFTAGRIAHAYGVSTHPGPGPGLGRTIGMTLTIFSFIGFAIALLRGALVHG
ncbi:MAG: MAPEG family protein [Alphaproteobacteria bacterium]